jgi:hypothetical protein
MVNRSVLRTRIGHRLPRVSMPLGIKILDERKDAEGNDTFVLCDWWRCNSGELPNFAFVLRAVLSHSPNSCPPERLFSIFNAAFDLWKNERAVDRRPTTLPRGTRHFACCAGATCSPRVRNLQPEGAQPAALGHDRDFRSSMILSRQHLDTFLIFDRVSCTSWLLRRGIFACGALAFGSAVRSLCFRLQRSLCAAVAAGAAG